jgi:hypothetical protein
MRVFRPNSLLDSCKDQKELGNSGYINRTRIDYLQEALPTTPRVGEMPEAFPLNVMTAFQVSRRPILLPRKIQDLPGGKH